MKKIVSEKEDSMCTTYTYYHNHIVIAMFSPQELTKFKKWEEEMTRYFSKVKLFDKLMKRKALEDVKYVTSSTKGVYERLQHVNQTYIAMTNDGQWNIYQDVRMKESMLQVVSDPNVRDMVKKDSKSIGMVTNFIANFISYENETSRFFAFCKMGVVLQAYSRYGNVIPLGGPVKITKTSTKRKKVRRR